jgi:YVTN family beta-propeller protein
VPDSILNDVVLTWCTVATHTVSVTNNAANDGDITVDFTDNMTVTLPNGFDFANAGTAQVQFLNVAGNGGTAGPAEASVDEQGLYSYPPPLAVFEGPGLLNLLSDGTSVFMGAGPGSLLIDAASVGQATLCATYTYTALSTINGRVYNDANHNGVFDGGDANMAGVEVCLHDGDTTLELSCQLTTAAGGAINFEFGGLLAGNYYVVVTPPAGYICTSPASCQSSTFALAEGETRYLEFGLYLPPPPAFKNIIFEGQTNRLFVADRNGDLVRVFDASTLDPLALIPIGDQPVGMASLGGQLYVTNSYGNTVSVIDPLTDSVVATINLLPCGSQPMFIAANTATNKLYVALHGSGRVAVIDGATDTLDSCVTGVGGGTFGIAVNEALNLVYLTNRDSFDLRVIDGASDTLLATPNVVFDGSPYQLAADPSVNRIYVAVSTPGDDYEIVTRLFVYDVAAGAITPVAGTPLTISNNHDGGGVAASACSGKVYVAESANDTVRVLNSDLTLNTILNGGAGIGDDPYGLAFGNNQVFVTNRGSATITALTECP